MTERDTAMAASFALLYGEPRVGKTTTAVLDWRSYYTKRDRLMEQTDLDTTPAPPLEPLTREARRARKHMGRKARRAARRKGRR